MIMASVIIYTTMTCPYCLNAKSLLDAKGVSYKEVFVDKDPVQREEMLAKSNGRRTVPQIFINGEHVGGYDDLKTLQDNGKLDPLLNKET